MTFEHIVPPDFRWNTKNDERLEELLFSLKPNEELEVFIHPCVGRGFMGGGDHSDAVTGVLRMVYEYCLELHGGKVREMYINAFKEFLDVVSKEKINKLYFIASAVNILRKKDDQMFKEGPIHVFLYRDYDHFFGRYIDYDIKHRMVANLQYYLPSNPEKIKEVEATQVSFIRIMREKE